MTTQVQTTHQDLTIGCTVAVQNQDHMEPVKGYLLTVQVEGVDVIYYVEVDGIVQGYRASELTPVAVTESEQQHTSLYEAVVASANLTQKLDRAKSKLAMLRYDMVQRIKQDDDLRQLQESIDLLDGHTKQLEDQLKLAKSQARDKAIAAWQPGSPKQLMGGVLTVNELTGKVHVWDEQKALDFALTQSPEFQKVLLKPNKTAFKGNADVLDIPTDAFALGTDYSASFDYDKLIDFVTFDMLEADDSPIASTQDKNVLDSVENDEQVSEDWSDVPF